MVGTAAWAAGRAKPKDPLLHVPVPPGSFHAHVAREPTAVDGASADGHGIWSVRPSPVAA